MIDKHVSHSFSLNFFALLSLLSSRSSTCQGFNGVAVLFFFLISFLFCFVVTGSFYIASLGALCVDQPDLELVDLSGSAETEGMCHHVRPLKLTSFTIKLVS